MAQPALGDADLRQPAVRHFLRLDIQMLEGALDRLALRRFPPDRPEFGPAGDAGHKHIINNLLIGTGTVLLLGYCSAGAPSAPGSAPYHLLAEWAEKIHLNLAKKKLVTDQTMDRRLRTVFWVIFALLAIADRLHRLRGHFADRYPVRALIYGPAWRAVGGGPALLRGFLRAAPGAATPARSA